MDVNQFIGTEDEFASWINSWEVGPGPTPSPENFIRVKTPYLGLLANAPSEAVKKIQGSLLALGYGPDGLVGRDGRPDGIAGPKTTKDLVSFIQRSQGSDPETAEGDVILTQNVWWLLHYGI